MTRKEPTDVARILSIRGNTLADCWNLVDDMRYAPWEIELTRAAKERYAELLAAEEARVYENDWLARAFVNAIAFAMLISTFVALWFVTPAGAQGYADPSVYGQRVPEEHYAPRQHRDSYVAPPGDIVIQQTAPRSCWTTFNGGSAWTTCQ